MPTYPKLTKLYHSCSDTTIGVRELNHLFFRNVPAIYRRDRAEAVGELPVAGHGRQDVPCADLGIPVSLVRARAATVFMVRQTARKKMTDDGRCWQTDRHPFSTPLSPALGIARSRYCGCWPESKTRVGKYSRVRLALKTAYK